MRKQDMWEVKAAETLWQTALVNFERTAGGDGAGGGAYD